MADTVTLVLPRRLAVWLKGFLTEADRMARWVKPNNTEGLRHLDELIGRLKESLD